MRKGKMKNLLSAKSKKDPQKLTIKEKLMRSEVERRKMMTCDCFGLHDTDFYYQTHTAEEAEIQWRNDIDNLKKVLEEYERKIATGELEQPEKKKEKNTKSRSKSKDKTNFTVVK